MAIVPQYIAHWEQEDKTWYGPFESAAVATVALRAAALGPEKTIVKVALLFPPPASQEQLKREREQQQAKPPDAA